MVRVVGHPAQTDYTGFGGSAHVCSAVGVGVGVVPLASPT